MVKGTAIVVTYNSGVWAERCLEALLAQPGWEVLMIDNASDDDTVSRASRFASQARIFRNTVNTGFAGGVNQGVRLASGEVMVLVNPDALAAPGALDKLAESLSKNNAGAAGGLLMMEDGKPQTGNMVRRLPTLGSALAELLLLNNIWRRNPWNRSYRCLDLDYTRAQPVENPAGASLAFRKSVWESVGGFDEGFFPVWFEDADFCACVLEAGWPIMYEPGAVFDHGGAHSVKQISFYQHQLIWYRNMLRYFGKHYGGWQRALLRVAIAIGSTLRALLCLVTTPPKVSRKQGIGDYMRVAWSCGVRNPKAETQPPRSLTSPPPIIVGEPVQQ
jgi:N-acetylglucosaminyl-diphospho-decaprenol L-rhamnosyltransferase